MTVQVLDRPTPRQPAATRLAIADCDIHPSPKSLQKEVYPFLDRRWQHHLETYGAPPRHGSPSGPAYPKGPPDDAPRAASPPGGRRPGSDPPRLRDHHLPPHNLPPAPPHPHPRAQG